MVAVGVGGGAATGGVGGSVGVPGGEGLRLGSGRGVSPRDTLYSTSIRTFSPFLRQMRFRPFYGS